ncbi:MAG: putative Two-component sensor [Massilia sp.]|nr:putative Two-component sensor [Massilia sp.]
MSQAAAAPVLEAASGYRNMQQLIQLRWIAVIGQITTIATATLLLGIHLPVADMLRVLACLIGFNIFSHLRWHEQRVVDNKQLFLALLVDVFSLTAQLYLSGGMSNPFVFLYMLQVILAAVLLQPWSSWTIVAITGVCAVLLAAFAKPLNLPLDYAEGMASLYVEGIFISFIVNAALLVVFITRITRNVRTGDAALADLRQRAAEEEHIVRMGLLASGAAHELGTPLATLAVILGDWRRMPEFKKNPELLAELAEMQAQIARCKAIVSGILMSAGEARGESSVKTTIKVFLDELVAEWRASRTLVQFEYSNGIEHDVAVVSDSTLKQMIANVLDNALEASPHWLRLEASQAGDELVIEVLDAGPGFAPGMLREFGKPYQSTKGQPGRGLGLFLVVNVARTLGGSVAASNRDVHNGRGGAAVKVTLPMSAIALETPHGQ